MSTDKQDAIMEFLYMDPDTNIIVCMVADDDGFRPAHAHEELECSNLQQLYKHSSEAISITAQSTQDGAHGMEEIDSFFQQYDQAYLRPSA